MANFDVFNGDADGICALTQLRLAEPREATLVTGVKRDISLLSRVNARAGDKVTILDISLEKNVDSLQKALANGAECFYVDHHFPGDIPEHPALKTIINTAADTCTSILVNGYLKGAYLAWAVVGAFGDNLRNSALGLARNLDCSEEEINRLEELGILINYNGYGAAVADLHFSPEELFRRVSQHRTPLDFMARDEATYLKLKNGYQQDMAAAAAVKPLAEKAHAAVFLLPDEAWARRVSGVYSNDLANQFAGRAHAIITERANGTYLISVRAPLSNKTGADEICRQFPTGGGRKAAAGVNELPGGQLDKFIQVFSDYYA